MALLVDNVYLDKLILTQRKTIRVYLSFTLGLVFLGIVIIAVAFVFPGWVSQNFPFLEDTYKQLFGLGGAFISALGTLPYKEILNRNEKIQAYEIMKEKIRLLDKVPRAKRAESEKQLEDLSW